MVAAGAVGFLLFFVAGPFGIVLRVASTVFLSEFLRTRDRGRSLDAAFYATAGMLASAAVQFLLTLAILVAFLVALMV
ncbi:MAG: DUF456 domain-containing protein [Candidatus Nanohaloarchaea archaeon]